MATNTRQAVRDAIKRRIDLVSNYIARLEMIFDNCIRIKDLPKDLPKRYLLKVLRECGGIAYDKQTKLYLRYVKKGIDVYGLPQSYNLYGYDGYVVERNPDEIVILRTSDNEYCFQKYIEMQAERIADFDLAIEQNLEAVKTMSFFGFDDEKTMLSVANAANAKRIGATVLFVNKKSLRDVEHKVFNTGAEFLIDKLQEGRRKVINETLSAFGVNVANVDKKERVQGEEIRASQGYGIDSLKVLIDTFNYDASMTDDVKMRLEGNTSLYENYLLDLEKTKKEIKEGGKTNGKNA